MDELTALDALSALAQEARLEVFRLLVRTGAPGLPAGEIAAALNLKPNTLSTHLGILERAGLVAGTREGRIIRYAADMGGMRALLAFLMEDCCGGRPELCAPVLNSLEACGC